MHFTQKILNWAQENVNCLRIFQATWAKDVLWRFRLLLLRNSPLLGSRRECETLHNALRSSTRNESARRPNHRRWCLQRTSVGVRAGAGSRIGWCARRARRLRCEETRYRLLPLHLFPPRPQYSPSLPFLRSIPTTHYNAKKNPHDRSERNRNSRQKSAPTTYSNAKFRTTHCEKPLEEMTENNTSKTQIHVQRERILPQKRNPKSSRIRNPGESEILISQSTAKLENKRLPIPCPPTPPKTKKEIEKRPIQKLKEMLKKI